MIEFSKVFDERRIFFEENFPEVIADVLQDASVPGTFMESLTYTLFQGGKRFRPVLSLLVGESLGLPPQKILPWAASLEMVHTYSLIHDDLPSMDNDDERRGAPTNHKIFGEAFALLSGDTLVTEAFGVLARNYSSPANVGLELVQLLQKRSGLHGMTGGQALDLATVGRGHPMTESELLQMHDGKTGALIRACCEGPAIIAQVAAPKREALSAFGLSLGRAFQLADDLLDAETDLDDTNAVTVLGKARVETLLSECHEHGQKCLSEIGLEDSYLHAMMEMNRRRKQ